ncbi:ABC transporter ATP-binding protein [Thermodesulfovibrio hydrogeniphilus]
MLKKILITKNIKKTYSSKAGKIEVLKGIDFTATEGDIIAVTGASGVGKSTFLHIIGTLEKPSSGEIVYNFNNEDIQPLKLSDESLSYFRNKFIGFIFQFHYLLPEFSVIENVIMPGLISKVDRGIKKSEFKDRAYELLKKLGIHERAHNRPGELSGGEQQRVAVARALFNSPKIVLADEPTGNLDSRSAMELFDLFRKINDENRTTFIIVTHNEAIAKMSTKRFRMLDGILFDEDNTTFTE